MLAFALLLVASAAALKPSIPRAPPASATKLDRRVASLSIEFSYLPAFGGNNSAPNELTRSLIQRIVERTGVGPDVRPGGITVDSSVYDPTLKVGAQLVTSPTGGIYKTVLCVVPKWLATDWHAHSFGSGPAYFEALNVFPNSSRIIWSVNLGNNTVGFAQAGVKGKVSPTGTVQTPIHAQLPLNISG